MLAAKQAEKFDNEDMAKTRKYFKLNFYNNSSNFIFAYPYKNKCTHD